MIPHGFYILFFSRSLNIQVLHMAQKRGRGKGKGLLESRANQGDVIKCYWEIERLFRELQMSIRLRKMRGLCLC